MSYIGYGVIAIVSVLLRGLVLTKLWAWFVVPIGFPTISIVHAIGISVMALFIFGDRPNDKSFKEKLIGSVVSSLFIWGVGAIIHIFM